MTDPEKAKVIARANNLECVYAKFLQINRMRNASLTQLKKYATPEFIDRIIRTYQKKLQDGEFAKVCSFPVPPEEMIEHEDGTVSFAQHVHIEWSGGQVDDFTTTHVYVFEDGKIAGEHKPDGGPIRRQAE